MPNLHLSDLQFKHVRRACLDYVFLGHEFDDEWTRADEEKLRRSIFRKFHIHGNDSPYISNHDDSCKCAGCRNVRKERKELANLYERAVNQTG